MTALDCSMSILKGNADRLKECPLPQNERTRNSRGKECVLDTFTHGCIEGKVYRTRKGRCYSLDNIKRWTLNSKNGRDPHRNITTILEKCVMFEISLEKIMRMFSSSREPMGILASFTTDEEEWFSEIVTDRLKREVYDFAIVDLVGITSMTGETMLNLYTKMRAANVPVYAHSEEGIYTALFYYVFQANVHDLPLHTPLLEAICKDSLAKGVQNTSDSDISEYSLGTPLQLACENKHTTKEQLMILLNHGCNPQLPLEGEDFFPGETLLTTKNKLFVHAGLLKKCMKELGMRF